MTIMTDVGRRARIQPYLRLAGVPLDPQWPDFHRNHYIGMRLSHFFGRGERIRTSDPHTPSVMRSEEHTSELQSLMRISYAVFCLKNKTNTHHHPPHYALLESIRQLSEQST